MSAASVEGRALAEEYEARAAADSAKNASTRDALLPSSIMIYKTGRILYSCQVRGALDKGLHSGDLFDRFEEMVSALPVNHVHGVLLRNLHHAHASLIVAYAASATTTSASISAMSAMTGKPPVSASWEDIREGTESLCGIYLSSVSACQRCCLSLSSAEGRRSLELPFVSLSWVYDYLSSKNYEGNGGDSNSMQKLILNSLSKLLVHGAVQGSGKSEEDTDEQLSNVMSLIQNIQSSIGEHNCSLGDMLDMDEDELGDQTFIAALCSKFEAGDTQPPQLQYLLSMLRSSPKSNSKKTPQISASKTSKTPIEESAQSEPQQSITEIQISHVKSILPALGEGYIEEALKCYNHDMDRTLEALLQASEGGDNSGIHPRLLSIPTNLPRKIRDRVDHYSANVNLHRGATAKDDGKEHANIQKQHLKHVERQAEEEAFLIDNVSRNLGGLKVSDNAAEDDPFGMQSNRNEYEDDYDDQYDGIGDDGGMAGGIGGMDEGLYDVDIHNVHQKYDRGGAKNEQEMWRKYNSLIKDVDAESQFWENNRNLNREGGRPGKGGGGEGEDGAEKKYRGPDKGRGGRLIGPDGKYLPIKRGGKKGRGGGGGGGGGNNNAGRGAGRGGGRGGGGGGSGRGGGPKGESKAGQSGDGAGELSNAQKRRKNNNKAKIGNHHRKDRATKKAAGGMVM